MLNIEESSTGIEKFIPALAWLRRYPRSWLRPDIVAGLVSSAVVIPQAMAYATLAGLPVEVGLYTALVAIPVYAFLGTSRPLSVSVTSTIAILTATTLASVVRSSDPYDYILPAATLAIIVGGLLLIAAVLRLSFIANFISAPVLTGFKAGIGLVIFVGQLGKLLGISVDKSGPFETLLNLIRNLNQLSLATMILSAITLAILLLLVAAIGLMDITEFRSLRRLRGDEFWWAVIAFAGVAFIGTLEGIVIAIIVTLVDLIRHASDPPIYEVGRKPGTRVYRSLADHPSDETIEGMLLLRSEGLIFFGNASALRQKIRAIAERERPTTLVLELSAVPAIEYSGLKELTGLEEELRESGIVLWQHSTQPYSS